MKTTFFKKNELYVKISKIILDNTEYDLLELGEKSLQCVYIVQKLQIIDLKMYNIIKYLEYTNNGYTN